jgi:hypothetical protein
MEPDMSLQLLFWSVLAAATFILLPIVLIRAMVVHLRGRGSQRRGTGGISAGIGAALQELDRLTTRPSIEHKVETERPTLKREDDSGSD